ncbi:hypothetical protein [Clostridium butyricum]|uniref:hypothetical protein n=1 Tax=Clostridium butyricum TaxID=1492 RepID=UPI00325B2C5E
MYTIVFSKEDRDLLISKGEIYLGEQNLGQTGYIFKKIKNINFEKLNIKQIETNDMVF